MIDATVPNKCILIRINKLYRPDMTEEALYEATRGTWVLGPRRNEADYAFAVYKGIIQEVYRIELWCPAGTLEYATRIVRRNPRRWEFKGEVARDIRDKYVGLSVKHCFKRNAVNPIAYT